MKKIIKRLFLVGIAAIAVHMLALHIIFEAPRVHSLFIRDKVGSRVVKVIDPKNRSGGTGFFVKAPSGKTYILTNKHVCGLPVKKSISIKRELGKIILSFKSVEIEDHVVDIHHGFGAKTARVIKLSKKHDLCLIESTNKEIEGLSVSGSKLYPGMPIRLVGHPRLTPLQISKGEFLGYSQTFLGFMITLHLPPIRKVGWIDASTYAGNSGSPVVDMLGRVVGVLFAGQATHISLIVPKEFVIDFLKDM